MTKEESVKLKESAVEIREFCPNDLTDFELLICVLNHLIDVLGKAKKEMLK